jgi:hypothetical protein
MGNFISTTITLADNNNYKLSASEDKTYINCWTPKKVELGYQIYPGNFFDIIIKKTVKVLDS